MSQMIESIESRLLLTAAPEVILADLGALKATVVASKADLKAALNTAKADVKALRTSVTAAHPTAAQRAPLNTLVKDETAAVVKYRARVTGLLNSGTREGLNLLAALKNLKAHPNSIVFKAKVTTDLALLQGLFSTTNVSNIESNATATVGILNTDLNAIATAIPATQSAVHTFNTDLDNDLTTLSTKATDIQTGIATLANDLA